MKIGLDSTGMVRKRVGQFSIAGHSLRRPREYMESRGDYVLARICAGTDTIFSASLPVAPIDPATGKLDRETLLLQRLQADYMTWKGGL